MNLEFDQSSRSADKNFQVNTDHYFTIGAHHQSQGMPCQDYAYSGRTNDNVDYVIVSDGCSASKDSDLGSRGLTHWFRNILMTGSGLFPASPFEFSFDEKKNLISDFVGQFNDFALPSPLCLDATLVAAFHHRAMDRGYILVAGDGGFAFKMRDGTIQSHMVHVSHNMPPYLSYHLDKNRKASYIGQSGSMDATVDLLRHLPNDQGIVVHRTMSAVDALGMGFHVYPFDPNLVETVAVFTDGVASFGTGSHSEPFYGPMKQLMDVKTFEGQFVTRTCLGNLKRMAKEGRIPGDDLSMAALYFDDSD